MTHRERILAASKGELPEIMPYVPRIDLWYNSNKMFGTLPKKYEGKTQDEISRAEGWALHKIVPEFLNTRTPDDSLHRGIGIYALKEMVFRYKFASDIKIEVNKDGDSTQIHYHTPVGTVSTTTVYNDDMKRAGASVTWIDEHILKTREDYRVVGYIFENLELEPDFEDFIKWKDYIGDDGVAFTMVQLAASPMHHIQKEFLDATQFYFHYNDYKTEMRELEAQVGNFYNQALKIIAESPAEGVLWGANFDDMITYPAYFEKDILPWIKKASEVLGDKGKIVVCHCDGENEKLLDLIKTSNMHVAEAICPYPMTKVKIEEYYRKWADKLTIFGGIPSSMLLNDLASEDEFEAFMDLLFKSVVPGRRFIAGIADTTPPDAVFERLVRIGERIEKEGRLPLEAGGFRPVTKDEMVKAEERLAPEGKAEDGDFQLVREDVLKGAREDLKARVREMAEKGFDAQEILNRGMLSAMEAIGEKFKTGEVYIPEVLLSARALNEALEVLEPYLARGKREAKGKVLIGTVQGDLHDIGKNMVTTMLRGVGFEVKDIGVNVPREQFVEEVRKYQPNVLGLSALLTTTLSEMKNVIEALEAAGLRGKVKIILGGAPVNERFARKIGADAYGADAGSAVSVVKDLVRK